MIGKLSKNMCFKCQSIPKLKSFKKRLLRRKENRDTTKIRNEFLTSEETNLRLSALQRDLKEKDSKLFLLNEDNKRLKRRRSSLLEKMKEYSKRGSMKMVCHQLNRAADEGKLEKENVLKEVLSTCASNIVKRKQGKRYSKSVKEFYGVLMYYPVGTGTLNQPLKNVIS